MFGDVLVLVDLGELLRGLCGHVAGRVAQRVLERGIHHDRDAVDRADLAVELVAVHVADRLVLFAWEQVEPVVEHAAGHDGPFLAREADLGGAAVSLALRAADDPLLCVLHPVLVGRIAGVLAAVGAVVAVDGVQLAGVPVAEHFVPLDAVAPADRLGRVVMAMGRALVGHRVVEGVGEAATVQVSDVEARAHGDSVLSSYKLHDFFISVNQTHQKTAIFVAAFESVARIMSDRTFFGRVNNASFRNLQRIRDPGSHI